MDTNQIKEKIAARLGLDADAVQSARTETPATDATALSGHESGIMAAARQFGQKHIALLDTLREETGKAADVCEKMLRNSEVQRRQAVNIKPPESNMDDMRQAQNSAISAYKRFQNDNKLLRDASGDDRLVQFIWIIVIIIVESALNSHFFAPASGHGVLGGFATASFISIVNVGFAFWAGVLGLRYAKNHCNPAANLGGLFWFLLCILVCAMMISLATFYRGHIETFRSDDLDSVKIAELASAMAVKSLLTVDVSGLFSSVDSVILFFAGMLCAMAGVWKGYEYDDPYPGFGAMWRQKEDAVLRYQDEQQQHNTRINLWRQNQGGNIKQAESTLLHAFNKMKTELDGMNKKCNELAQIPDDTATLASALLQSYRTRNTEIRATDPPPYFSNYPGREDFLPLTEQAAEARRLAVSSREETDALLAKCKDEFRAIQESLE